MKISKVEKNQTSCSSLDLNFQELKEFILVNNWSPIVFENNYRKSSNFKSCQFLVLDYDDGYSLNEAIEEFKNFKHIIATTRSHQKDKNGKICDRFRVLLFLKGRIENLEEFQKVMFNFLKKYNLSDQKCKDGARYYYKSTKLISSNETGEEIDAYKFFIIGNEDKLVESTPVDVLKDLALDKEPLSELCIDLMKGDIKVGERNDSLFKGAREAISKGYSKKWCIRKLGKKLISEDFSEDEVEKTVESAINYASSDAFKKKLWDSKCLVDLENPKMAVLLNDKERNQLKCDLKSIRDRLGAKGYGQYKAYGKVIYCNFDYDPKSLDILTLQSNGLYKYNNYVPPLWKLEEDQKVVSKIPQIYDDFFKHLTSYEESEKSYNYLIDWLANILQDRNQTILTLVGVQGVGKGVLGQILRELVGKENYYESRDEILKNKFNAPLLYKQVVNIDEIDVRTKSAAFDKLKALINPTIEVEAKGENQKNVTNHANIFISSNRTDCIRISGNNRRFSVLELTDTPLRNTKIIEAIKDKVHLDKENIYQLAMFLLNHRIERDMLEPFVESKRFEELKEESLYMWEKWVIEVWAMNENNFGKRTKLKEFISMSKDNIQSYGRIPSQSKFIDLASKFPNYIKISQPFRNEGDGARYIESVYNKKSQAK